MNTNPTGFMFSGEQGNALNQKFDWRNIWIISILRKPYVIKSKVWFLALTLISESCLLFINLPWKGLDYEEVTKYTCEVQMREASLVIPPDNSGKLVNARATVFIHVLDVDEPPLFTQAVYNFSLREDAAPNSLFGGVSARDPDAARFEVQ